jgi:hypothetical protein
MNAITPNQKDDAVILRGLTVPLTSTRAVQAEHERRIRNGIAAQEAAAKEFANAPTILGNILRDNQASLKHRIEAARELRQTAVGNDENTPDSGEKFTIVINLGNDKLVIDKTLDPITPNKNNWEGSNVDEG